MPFKGWPGLSQRGRAHPREDMLLTRRLGLSHRGLVSHRETMPLKRRPGLSQTSQAHTKRSGFHRNARPLISRLGLSQGGWAFHTEARPLMYSTLRYVSISLCGILPEYFRCLKACPKEFNILLKLIISHISKVINVRKLQLISVCNKTENFIILRA